MDTMSAIGKLSRLVIVLVLAVTAGCTTTKLLSVWKDPEYAGPPRNVMVIGVMANIKLKAQFEEEFAKELKARGIDAIAASSVLPAAGILDRNVIVGKMLDVGVDTVIITRVIDKKTVMKVSAGPVGPGPGMPSATGWYGYYSFSPGEMLPSVMASTQTNIYDLKTERLVWSAVSDTWVEGSEDNLFLIRTFVPVIMKKLTEDKIVNEPRKTPRS